MTREQKMMMDIEKEILKGMFTDQEAIVIISRISDIIFERKMEMISECDMSEYIREKKLYKDTLVFE